MDQTELRTWRQAAGMTQAEVADALGVRVATISDWERGVKTPAGRLLELALRGLALEREEAAAWEQVPSVQDAAQSWKDSFAWYLRARYAARDDPPEPGGWGSIG